MLSQLEVLQIQRQIAPFNERARIAKGADETASNLDAYIDSLGEGWATRAWLSVTSHPDFARLSGEEIIKYVDELFAAANGGYCDHSKIDPSAFHELVAPSFWARIQKLVSTPMPAGGAA